MTSLDPIRALYPQLTFHRQWQLAEETVYELGQCDSIVESIAGTPILPGFASQLHELSLRKGAQATTAIEGNTLSDDEVDRVADGASLPPNQAYQAQEVRNILEAFNELLNETTLAGHVEFVSPALLQRFHRMIGKNLGPHFAAQPGQFAQSRRVVGPYRAPAPEHVPHLVDELCRWLREEFHFPEQSFRQAVLQAIVTHVYIEWIHPFDDGNGRTGRLAEFYILLRAGLPSIASHLLANYYNETRSEYYRQLQRAGTERDLSAFIAYAVTGLRDGLRSTLEAVRTNTQAQMWRVLVYDTFATHPIKQREVFRRQRGVALALPLGRPVTIPEVTTLTPELAASYAKATSERTVVRDLQLLESLNLIRRSPGLVEANARLLEMTLARRRAAAQAG